MIGAILGDIIGSQYEFNEDKRTKDFKLFTKWCHYTDDSLMTLAVSDAILYCRDNYENLGYYCIKKMQKIFQRYKDFSFWGNSFYSWLNSYSPKPYNSCGNGSAMRISPVGWIANSEKEVIELTKKVTEISHNHPEGIKGATAIAMGVYLARMGKSKEEIKNKLSKYYPQLNKKFFTVDELLKTYNYDSHGDWILCQGSTPQAIVCFLESNSFEDAIRNAVAIGGDSDTIGAMTGAIAEAFYGVPKELEDKAISYLEKDYDLVSIYLAFKNKIKNK